jgi:lipopolysaccharide biosynthesis glycosyltransferase
MKLLVTTRADSEISDITEQTHFMIKKYANKCNADFHIIDEDSECKIGNGKFHFKIMELYNLLDEYDRILCIDSDVIIKEDCPNLFEVVPYDCIGTIYEDRGSRIIDRRIRIREVQEIFGEIGWKEGYINTGTFLVSKPHKEIFQKINGEFWVGRGFDDVHLGYQIKRNNICIHEIPYQYNHMTMFSESWNDSADRFDSYIIHYAGVGIFDSDINNNKEEQISRDIEFLNNKELV